MLTARRTFPLIDRGISAPDNEETEMAIFFDIETTGLDPRVDKVINFVVLVAP